MPNTPAKEPWGKYGDIVATYRELIETGKIAPGTKITTQQLAIDEGVHRNTAYRVITELKKEGHLRGTPTGTVVMQRSRHDRLREQLIDTLNELGVRNLNDYVRWDPEGKTWVLNQQP